MTVRQALARTVEQEGERQRTPAQLIERDRTRVITWGDVEYRCCHTESEPAVRAS
jgi:hypothetical protein